MNDSQRRSVASAFALLKVLRDNAIGPQARLTAEMAAGNCLHALGIDEWGGIKAVPAHGETIDLDSERF